MKNVYIVLYHPNQQPLIIIKTKEKSLRNSFAKKNAFIHAYSCITYFTISYSSLLPGISKNFSKSISMFVSFKYEKLKLSQMLGFCLSPIQPNSGLMLGG